MDEGLNGLDEGGGPAGTAPHLVQDLPALQLHVGPLVRSAQSLMSPWTGACDRGRGGRRAGPAHRPTGTQHHQHLGSNPDPSCRPCVSQHDSGAAGQGTDPDPRTRSAPARPRPRWPRTIRAGRLQQGQGAQSTTRAGSGAGWSRLSTARRQVLVDPLRGPASGGPLTKVR
jgi:hypothetical protein